MTDKPIIEPSRLHADLKHELTVLLSEEDFVANLASGDQAERARRLSEALRSALYVIDLHRSDRAEIARLRAREALLERALELACEHEAEVSICPAASYGVAYDECVDCFDRDGAACFRRYWLEQAAEEAKADADPR